MGTRSEAVLWRLKTLLLLLALVLFAALAVGAPALAQDDAAASCGDYDSQQAAQDAADDDDDLEGTLDTDNDGQVCEDFDFTQNQQDEDNNDDTGATAATSNVRAQASDVASLTCEELERFARSVEVQYGADGGQYVSEEILSEFIARCDVQSGRVIVGTIPGGVLANTGGLPLLPLAGALLVGAGVVLRSAVRRGP